MFACAARGVWLCPCTCGTCVPRARMHRQRVASRSAGDSAYPHLALYARVRSQIEAGADDVDVGDDGSVTVRHACEVCVHARTMHTSR